MKIYTSYFYQIRYFPKNLIPLSTAVWPPKWYKYGVDKRGVLNGITARPFVPDESCSNLCRGLETCNSNNKDCAFLKAYKTQLDNLSITEILQRFKTMSEKLYPEFGAVDFALIFHEAPNNPCSERWPVQQWFKEYGIPICEWHS